MNGFSKYWVKTEDKFAVYGGSLLEASVGLTLMFPVVVFMAFLYLLMIVGYLVIGAVGSLFGVVMLIVTPFAYLYDYIRFRLRAR